MSLTRAEEVSVLSGSPGDPGPQRRSWWLISFRVAWMLIALLALGIFIANIPIEFSRLQTVCAGEGCSHPRLSPESLRELQALGLSVGFFTTYFIILNILFGVVWFAVGGIIFWRKPNDGWSLFVALTLVLFGMTFTFDLQTFVVVYPSWWLVAACLRFLSGACLSLFVYLFPDGRFIPRWAGWLGLAVVVQEALISLLPASPFNSESWFLLVKLAVDLGLISGAVMIQVYRYRRVSSPAQRQQTKWIVFSITTALAVLIGIALLSETVLPPGVLVELAGNTAIYGAMLLIPLSIGLAILRYRLWDIDLLINRTLVYGALTTCVVGLYILVVGGLSALFQTSGNVFISLLATAVVAVLFAPLRDRLQRGVNRLLYGQRDEPYAVLSRLGQQLEATLAPDAVLPAIVATIKEALKLPYAALALDQEGRSVEVAAVGTLTPNPLCLPLTYQGEAIGQLILAPRAPGETFTPAERRLLTDLAHQAGVASAAVRLTTDLQRSRERLVTAREEERRRLRRDLHDGLGPALAAHTLKVGTARALLTRNPVAADTLLAELESDIQTALADIRRLVYNLRPPSLDELGLLGAIRETTTRYSTPENGPGRLQIRLETPEHLPPLPAAVEVAAYRILQEALTNVVRHAQAQTCQIQLSLGDDIVRLEIRDDGVGLPSERHAGVGLTSMRERAQELGGTCQIETELNGGVRVIARLPLPKNKN